MHHGIDRLVCVAAGHYTPIQGGGGVGAGASATVCTTGFPNVRSGYRIRSIERSKWNLVDVGIERNVGAIPGQQGVPRAVALVLEFQR